MGALNVAGMYRDLQNERSHPPPDHEIWYVSPKAFFHSLPFFAVGNLRTVELFHLGVLCMVY
jgi:hypothetical protein